MRGCTVGALVLVCAALAAGLPAKDALIQEMVGDTAVVESTIREVRAAPTRDSHEEGEKKQFIRTFGAAEDQKKKLHGYRKRVSDDSDDGYNHFDSYHKKKGDKYGYETYSSYGRKEHGDLSGAHEDSGAESDEEESSHYGGEESEDEDEGDGKETQHSYQVAEESEEGDDGESDSYGAGSSAEESEGDTENNYSTSESTGGSYSNGGETSSYHQGGKNYNSDGVGDSGEYSEGYSEGGSTSSSYASSEGDGGEESDDY